MATAQKTTKSNSTAKKKPSKSAGKKDSGKARTVASKKAVSSIEREKIDKVSYERTLEKLTILAISLEKATMSRDMAQEPTTATATFSRKSTGQIRDDKLGFQVHDLLSLRIKISGQEKPLVRMDVTLLLEYVSENEISEAFLAEFTERNVDLHSWPYFREFIHESMQRMGLPPLILPPRLT